jgi:hypothetical protein
MEKIHAIAATYGALAWSILNGMLNASTAPSSGMLNDTMMVILCMV